ncbi:MAG: hypothetical protein RJB66_2649 [Pseudomonadota bacterium]|jgi:hypothetical protein
MKRLSALFLTMQLLFSTTALASSEESLTIMSQSHEARKFFPHGMQAIRAIRHGDAQKVWLSSFSAVMNFALKSLREKGYHDIATQRETEWNFYAQKLAMGPVGLLDLGDHRPVCEWLGAFYEELERLLTKPFCEFFHLDDIKAFNYGYVVTYYPNGDPITHETWDKKEYKKHFVPFATASFYWSAYIACNVLAPGLASMGCSIGLMAPRYFVRRWVAPPLAVHVYQQAQLNKNSSAKLNNTQRHHSLETLPPNEPPPQNHLGQNN